MTAGADGAGVPPADDAANTKIKTRANLGWFHALWLSAIDADVDFYPRLNRTRPIWRERFKLAVQHRLSGHLRPNWPFYQWAQEQKEPAQFEQMVVSLKSDDLLRELPAAMKDWQISSPKDGKDSSEEMKAVLNALIKPGTLDAKQIAALRKKAKAALAPLPNNAPTIDEAIDLVKMSFVEVKDQTEYQDQKATRLLTVTTFLSALSGALFVTFGAAYPLQTLDEFSLGSKALLIFAYASFLLFVIAALGGALITFHATRTRFKYSDEATAARQQGPTRSFLFYREIIAVSPRGWADSFVNLTDGKASLRTDLKEQYFRNQVIETYLIAAKAADKLRYLGPAQTLLAWALRCLFLFVISFAAAQAFVPRIGASPSEVRLVAPEKPMPIDITTPVKISAPIEATSANSGSVSTSSPEQPAQ